MNVLTGTLQGEPLPFNEVDSINDLFRGTVVLQDSTIKRCLLKNIGRIELVNELLGFTLASKMGIPVPKAIIVNVPRKYNKNNIFNKAPDAPNGKYVYGSVDVQTPNLAQRLSTTDPLSRALSLQSFLKWPLLSSMYAFDSWVANTDRHDGNILHGSDMSVWLIDHGRCLTGENWQPADLIPNQVYDNKLKGWLTHLLGINEISKSKAELKEIQKSISLLDVRQSLVDALASNFLKPKERQAVLDFLATRVSRVEKDASAALSK